MTSFALRVRLLCAVSVLAGACSSTYRPAQFADRPPVTAVRDDAPVPQPSIRRLNDVARLTNAYLRLPVIGALDVERTPEARDINGLDEVPSSSWFAGGAPGELVRSSYVRDGPPQLPLRLTLGRTVTGGHGVSAVDARGVRYELFRDSPRLPETSTAAAAIASRLAYALGYRTPEVYVGMLARQELQPANDTDSAALAVDEFLTDGPPEIDGCFRVSATRWPVGIDVGLTPAYGVRSDDPNDRIAHEDRRTLRALKVVAAWLDLRRLGPENTRDVYVGKPGRGHLLHYLLGLHRSLGAGRLRGQRRRTLAVGEVHGGVWENLFTLGLIPEDKGPQSRATSLFALKLDVKLDAYSPPYEPAVRMLPQDSYWIAKRMARVSDELLRWAIDGGSLSHSPVREHLRAALESRRRHLLSEIYSQLSPLEAVRTDGKRLVLQDEANRQKLEFAAATLYLVRYLDQQGHTVAPSVRVRASKEETAISLPTPTTDTPRYLVVSVRASRQGKPAPRPFEAHLIQTDRGGRVVGVRH